jgi:bifunctional enzyme CysN/CysC
MDLVDFSEKVFQQIKSDYSIFLNDIRIKPLEFVPISARDGINLTVSSELTPWYKGLTVIDLIDTFIKEKEEDENNFRMYVQGVYKFTANGDNRRIIAGTVNSGTINVGDEIVFLPSGKKSTVKTIENYGKQSITKAGSEEAIGITLETQIYVKPSELICRIDEREPYITDRFRANIFWMGKIPLTYNKKYKLKIGTNQLPVVLEKLENVLDASVLENSKDRKTVERHEVAQGIFRTSELFSFDIVGEIKTTSRFVLVDGYEIAGGGIIVGALEKINSLRNENPVPDIAAFKVELKNLFDKYFPDWGINI